MTERLRIERITRAIGAEVTGANLRDLAVVDRLHAALIEHQVLVMRDAHLPPTAMAALGRAFGEVGARHHSYTTHPDTDDVVVLDWHGDMLPDAAE